MRTAVLAAIALLCSAGACGGGSSSPAANDLGFLQIGTDPAAEAESSSLALAQAGYLLDVRLDGRGFVAIGGARRRDGASAVRIFTSRGAALALDAPDARFPDRRRVRLLAARAPFELDGAPDEEIAIEVELAARRCLAIVGISEDGAAVEVPLPLADLPGSPCVERLADVVGDGRPELLATLRFDAAGLEPAPTVPFALGAEGGQHRPLPPGLARAFYRRERAAREEAVPRASAAERLRLGVELAAIARLEGRSAQDVLAAFDRIAAPAEGLDAERGAARAFVAGGLGLGSGLPRDGVLDGPP